MSERFFKRLVGAALALIAVWLLVTWIGGRNENAAAPPPEALAGFFNGLGADQVDSVTVRGPGRTLVLAGGPAAWTVNGFRADSATMARFWSTVASSSIADQVARNPANHARMGLAADSAIAVTFHAGEQDERLLVGKAGARYGTAFVRLPGEDPVYLLDGDLRAHVTRNVDEWRDKRLTAVDTALVSTLEVHVAAGSYRLLRSDTVWTIEDDNATASATAVRNILSELSDLRASGFLAAGDSLAVLPAAGSVTALDTAGDTLGHVNLGAGEGDRWARVSGDSVIYRLPSWKVSRLAPLPDQVR